MWMRIPVLALAAVMVVLVVAGLVCAWCGRRYDREVDQVLPLAVSEDVPHPP